MKYLLLGLLILVGCGDDGRNGINGRDGCNTYTERGDGGIVIMCGNDQVGFIPDSKDGVDGLAGVDGNDGQNGIDGLAGVDGQDGIQGIQGVDGQDGIVYDNSLETYKSKCEGNVSYYTECYFILSGFYSGKLHRVDGPAYTTFNAYGNTRAEAYYNLGRIHRENGPAFVGKNLEGFIILENYYIEGFLHRLTGPAKNNYYENGNIKSEYYYSYGYLHNINGPARLHYNEDGSIYSQYFYINGELLTEQEFNNL